MKRTINGKTYNTDTAEELAVYDNGQEIGSVSHFRETLYRKRTDEFFIFGFGGAWTRYGEPMGNYGRFGGSQLIPVSKETAMSWVERCCGVDTYIRIFGELPD